MHLWALNRGILLTPFHNMALFSPHHTEADVDRHTEVFRGRRGLLVHDGDVRLGKAVDSASAGRHGAA